MRTMFELMPFENRLVVLTLDGVAVDSLAQQIARARGEPIAGWSFVIDAEIGAAQDVRVADEPLERAASYRLVTIDYLVDGTDRFPALRAHTGRFDTSVLLRDAIAEYIRAHGTVAPAVDGRIRLEE